MRLFTVCLNCQPLLLPKQIHLDAIPVDVQLHVAAGNRQSFFDEEGKEPRLEAAANYWAWFRRVSPRSKNRA